jgi:hypothetical protein
MLIGRNGNDYVHPEPGGQATCPTCAEELTAKCGDIVTWHWAHKTGTDCDSWSEGETEWHARWKLCAPINRREVTFGTHRADVVAGDGVICEIQHSDIAVDDVIRREAHYGNMRWIFHVGHRDYDWEPFSDGRWKIHRKHTWHAIGACEKRVMLDFGQTGVLSCERINNAGTFAWGYLYEPATIGRWIAGPEYREGWKVTTATDSRS